VKQCHLKQLGRVYIFPSGNHNVDPGEFTTAHTKNKKYIKKVYSNYPFSKLHLKSMGANRKCPVLLPLKAPMSEYCKVSIIIGFFKTYYMFTKLWNTKSPTVVKLIWGTLVYQNEHLFCNFLGTIYAQS